MMSLSGQQQTLESSLTESIGATVSMESLQGDWFHFSPVLALQNLKIAFDSESGKQASHEITSLNIKLDMVASLLKQNIVVDQVSLHELTLELAEGENGKWSVVGFGGGNADYTQQIIDAALNVNDLQLTEAKFLIHRLSGEVITLNNVYAQLQNNLDSHHLQVQFRVQDQPSPAQFSLMLEGDPRLNYSAAGYLQFSQLDFTQLYLDDIDGYAFPQFNASAQVWLDRTLQGDWQIQAALADLNIEVQQALTIDPFKLSNGSTTLSATSIGNKQWSMWMQESLFDLANNTPWSLGDLFVELDLQKEKISINALTEEVDLEIVDDFTRLLKIPESALTALDQLQPKGLLRNLKVNADIAESNKPTFSIKANLDNVSVGAWQGAPSAQGINGYLQATADSGFVELDSNDFTMHLPKVFGQAWHYNSINSRVHWALDNGEVKVNSSVIDASNENIHGRIQFELFNSRNEIGRWDSELTLIIGALNFDASHKSLYLPTLSKVESTMGWLEEALVGGAIENSGFIYRGLSSSVKENTNTVQTFYNVTDATLKFLPEWPQLEKVDAFVIVDNNNVDVSASSAQIEGMDLGPTEATVRPLGNNNGAWLNVIGQSQTTADKGLDFIKNSPVRKFAGDYIDNWQMQGQINVDIELGIPLNNNALENVIQVDVLTNNASLEMPEQALTFEALSGMVNYTSENGLNANALTAELFDFPLSGKIETVSTPNQEPAIRITTNGKASNEALQSWAAQPDFVRGLLTNMQGDFEYSAQFEVFDANNDNAILSHLDLTSRLNGIAIDMPYPFEKSVEEEKVLNISVDFFTEHTASTVQFGNDFSALLTEQNESDLSGFIQFGSSDLSLLQGQSSAASEQNLNGFVVGGQLDYFNFEQWQALVQNFNLTSEGQIQEQAVTQLNSIINSVHINIANFELYDMALTQVETQVERAESAWQVNLMNDMLKGEFSFPDDSDLPLDVALEYLRFPEAEVLAEPKVENLVEISQQQIEREEEQEEVDFLASINPAQLPNINFKANEISIGERNLGSWEFLLRTNGNGASISDFKMVTEGALITDTSAESGANLDWRFMNGMHTTSFNGRLHADDLAKMLPSWGFDANVQSESADFKGNLQWTGSPAAFSLLGANGQVEVDIRNGSFVDLNSDRARLFAAFNFDAIVRRLQLDFRDLYGNDLAYDRISGNLVFNEGLVTTNGRFLIQGPSSSIYIEGEIDIVNQMINADAQVNAPFSQNISVIAGMLGAWPVAVGTYLGGKIFKRQLEDITRVNYHLEGPWSELNAGFEPDESAVQEQNTETNLDSVNEQENTVPSQQEEIEAQ